jgi:hydrogenase maturation protein HypF
LNLKSSQTASANIMEKIRVRGIVQGVGFRPTVWKLAQRFQLYGVVSNDGDGVLIEIQGKLSIIDDFVKALHDEMPVLSRIDSIERKPLETSSTLAAPATSFQIIESNYSHANTGITADAATCKDCLTDIFDAENRRFHYPFTNCTHCGPRLSIIKGIPYDRAQTSMDEFKMCSSCLREYDSPDDRRFHAQPNACPDCGPSLWLEDVNGETVSELSVNDTPIIKAVSCLDNHAVVAIKGIGGIHLAVNACSEKAVELLRTRKHRPQKPFALMMTGLAMVEAYCCVSPEEQALLTSPTAPIVLLKRRKDASSVLAYGIAPGQKTLGVMLPYSPLHHLLMQLGNKPIVLTSANASHEPQCIDNDHCRHTLNKIADYFLLHNRQIENRVDDSVVRIMAGKPRFYRRARGYAPESFPLPKGFENAPDVLAMGGELKNTFCLLKNGQAILSQHMGDLENFTTYQDYHHNLALYEKLYQHSAKYIATDLHPEYLSSKAGLEIAEERGISCYPIQHHHAHIASCLAENQYPLDGEAVLGIVLDGLGYGTNHTLWGGEFLLADYRQSQRLAHLKPVALLGGSIAMKQPWRNTYAHLQTCLGWDWIDKNFADLELVKKLSEKPLTTLDAMLAQNLNCPEASSTGRLFDAVAAAVGICYEGIQYEGQAAIELENSMSERAWIQAEDSSYPFFITNSQLDPTPMWKALLHDLSLSTSVSLISARFHRGLSNAIMALASQLAKENKVKIIVLSGGVFQNKTLFEEVKSGLEHKGFSILAHQLLPANDGGLALGQAVVVAANSITGI